MGKLLPKATNLLKKKILLIIQILATGGIFFILYKIVPYREFLSVYKQVSPFYVGIGFLLIFLGNIIGALRWRYLLSHIGVPMSAREAVYIFLSASFFNIFFPSLVAGDTFRSFALISRYHNAKKVIFSVIMDRVSGFIAVTVLALSAFLLARQFITEIDVFIGISFLTFIAGIGMVATFNSSILSFIERVFKRSSSIRERIELFHNEFYLFRDNPFLFLKLICFFSLPIQIMTCVSYFCLAKAFFLQAEVFSFFVLVPIIMVIAFLPITAAGIGTRELATVYFFSKIGIAKATSLGIAFCNLFFMVLICLMGGIIYVVVYSRWLERSK